MAMHGLGAPPHGRTGGLQPPLRALHPCTRCASPARAVPVSTSPNDFMLSCVGHKAASNGLGHRMQQTARAGAMPTCARPHLVYHRYTTRNLDNTFMHMISVCPIFLMLLCLNNLAIVPRRMHEPCFIALVLHGCNWYVGGRVPSL